MPPANHSFTDGNKCIAAMLFLWFMDNNGVLYGEDGQERIADNTLVAPTLLIAESRTEEKYIMVKVVVTPTNKDNRYDLLKNTLRKMLRYNPNMRIITGSHICVY